MSDVIGNSQMIRRRFNSGDADAVEDLYEPEAVLISGETVTGGAVTPEMY